MVLVWSAEVKRSGGGLLEVEVGEGLTSVESFAEIKLKSLILAQIERWRHALHMQVERERGSNPPSRVANG